jgi:hypothetical protein
LIPTELRNEEKDLLKKMKLDDEDHSGKESTISVIRI